MEIYTFDKTFAQRAKEFKDVLDPDYRGRSVRDEWSDFLSVSIELAHYKAIWRLSRNSCEKYKIQYPAEVYGTVQDTDFNDFELLVDFKVEQVQDDNIQLPEVCRVPLDEVFPTIQQDFDTLDVKNTASILDSYRFFFNYIFLPFDEEENFEINKIGPRLSLISALQSGEMSKVMTSYVRHAYVDLKEMKQQMDELSLAIEDDADRDHSMNGEEKARHPPKEIVARLLRLQMRKNKYKEEFEILNNDYLREVYELVMFERKNEGSKETFLVSASGTINEHFKALEQLKERVSADTLIKNGDSLTHVISIAPPGSEIFLPKGNYTFDYLHYLYQNILICGLSNDALNSQNNDGNYATISAKDDSSVLFVIDGDMRFENLVIDCRRVKIGLLIKQGRVVLKNCLIIGSKDSSATEGFNISEQSSVSFNNCTISSFSTAINIVDESKLEMNNCKIEKCSIGVCIVEDSSKVSLKNSSISDTDKSQIVKQSLTIQSGAQKITSAEKENLESFGLNISNNVDAVVKVIPKLIKKGNNQQEPAMMECEDVENFKPAAI